MHFPDRLLGDLSKRLGATKKGGRFIHLQAWFSGTAENIGIFRKIPNLDVESVKKHVAGGWLPSLMLGE